MTRRFLLGKPLTHPNNRPIEDPDPVGTLNFDHSLQIT